MNNLDRVMQGLDTDGIHVECLRRSRCIETGAEVSSFFIRMPKIILPENNTHRVFSRNVGSGRAIPTMRLLADVIQKPFRPLFWGRNQAGMQSGELLTGWAKLKAQFWWWFGARTAAMTTKGLHKAGLHKQWANRPIEPYLYVSVLVTSTEWDNFFALRIHDAAQPEIISVAAKMKREMGRKKVCLVSNQNRMDAKNWHYCYITDEELVKHRNDPIYLAKLDTARAARTSYMTQAGMKPQPSKEIQTFLNLVGADPIHASPTEHSCYPLQDGEAYSGNFKGFGQFRKMVEANVGGEPLFPDLKVLDQFKA
jgi:hypothetical protein